MDFVGIISAIYSNLALPAIRLTLIAMYFLGAIMIIHGMHRLYLHSRYPERLIAVRATMLWMAGGMVVFAFPAFLDLGGNTLFGSADSPGNVLSYMGTEHVRTQETKILWNFISWLFTLYGAWAFCLGWVTLARAGDPAHTNYKWETGLLQVTFGLILYFNELWILAAARTANLIT